MQTLALVLYTAGLALFAWFYILKARRDAAIQRRLEIAEFKARCFEDCEHLDRAYDRIHAISDSCLRGGPVVRFAHPAPIPPTADHWYYRVRMDALDHLFTEEAVREARQRAMLLIPQARPKPDLPEPPTPV